MQALKSQQLRRENEGLFAKMTALNKKAKDENRDFTAEEDAEWNRMDAEFIQREKDIENAEKPEAREAKLAAREKDFKVLDKRRAGREGDTGLELPQGDGRHGANHVERAERRAKASRMLRAWASTPKDEWDEDLLIEHKRAMAALPKEIRALSALTGAAGAFTIAQDFMPELDKAMKSFSGIQDACRIINTEDGSDLPWPKMTDVANVGHRLTENVAAATNVDPTFAQTVLKSYVYTSDIILVPIPLLIDTEFDLESELFESVAERIGRIYNTEATLGTGSSQPRGLITALLADTTPVAAAAAGAIAYGDIVNLEHAVDPAYRNHPRTAFMMHDTILATLKKIVDSNGRPLFMPANDAPGTPGTFMNRPYFINQDMDNAVSTQKETIVFGRLDKYIVRRAGPTILMRLAERYADAFQVGFVCFQRLEGQLVSGSSAAVRVLQQP